MLTTSKSGWVGQCCSFTQLAPGLKRASLLFCGNGKLTFFSLQRKRKRKKSWKRIFFMTYFAFSCKSYGKSQYFLIFRNFQNFTILQAISQNIKICGWNWKFCFKRAWACNRKGPCSNHREQSKNVHVCMYVCMNRWMKECLKVKQKQLCNATKLFLILFALQICINHHRILTAKACDKYYC